MKLSVVIATKGRPDDLRRTLASLAGADPLPEETIVVDGDADRSAEPVVAEASGGSALLSYLPLAAGPDATAKRRGEGRQRARGGVPRRRRGGAPAPVRAPGAGLRRRRRGGRHRHRGGGRAAQLRQQALAGPADAVPRRGGHDDALRVPPPAAGHRRRARRGVHAGLPDERAPRSGGRAGVRRGAPRLRPGRGRGLLLPALAAWPGALPARGGGVASQHRHAAPPPSAASTATRW